MAESELIRYNDELSYKIVDNGYEIYNNGILWITQYDQYSKIYKPEGTYEENCLIQLEDLTRVPEPEEDPDLEDDSDVTEQ